MWHAFARRAFASTGWWSRRYWHCPEINRTPVWSGLGMEIH
jgi:hypothetical protein